MKEILSGKICVDLLLELSDHRGITSRLKPGYRIGQISRRHEAQCIQMVHLGQDRLDSRHFTLHVRIIGAEARQLRQNAGIVEVSVLLLQIRAVFGGDGSNLKVAGLPSAIDQPESGIFVTTSSESLV